MQDENQKQPLPAPIDEGRVVQVIVEYTGEKLGAFTMRGPSSGREYRFDASPWHRRNYVLVDDLGRFQGRLDFRILQNTLIDPEVAERERRERELADLRKQLAELEEQHTRVIPEVVQVVRQHLSKRSRRTPGKASGRAPGRGLGALLDCWMNCGGVGEYFRTPREAYDAIYGYLLDRAAPDGQIPPRARFPSMRSDAKRKRELTDVKCLWHCHPEAVPNALTRKTPI